MKLNDSNLADPLLLGCALGGPPWGGGPFGGQDLISTTTFPDEALLLPPNTNGGNGGNGGSLLCKGLPSSNSPTGQTGVELDALIMVQSSDSYAELKPLPPFDYGPAASQLALQNDPHLPQMGSASNSPPNHLASTTSNGGNNHHANNTPNPLRHGGSGGSTGSASSIGSSPPGNSFGSPLAGSPNSLFDVVSSSTSVPAHLKTELTEYLLNSDIDDIAALIGNAIADSTVPNLGIELGDPNGVTSSTIDPWTELDAWIESACQQNNTNEVSSGTSPTTGPSNGSTGNNNNGGGPNNNNNNNNNNSTNGNGNSNGRAQGILLDQDNTIHTSAEPHFLDSTSASTLQTLLSNTFSGQGNNAGGNGPPPMYGHGQHNLKHGHGDFQPTSILQSRLQAPPANGASGGGGGTLRVSTGGPGTSPSQLPESTTHFGLKVEPYTIDPSSPPFIDPLTGEVAQRPHTTHVSPPVVTSSMMGNPGGPGSGSGRYRKSGSYKITTSKSNGNSNNGHPNPNLANGGFTGHHGGVADTQSFLSAFGSPTTSSPFDPSNHGISDQNSSKLGLKTKRKSSKMPSSTGLGSPLDPCGKEKPIHRCNVCNRGFLNKSNIKVHLRTHTGEKPFKCDVCGKAFRQKAHLLKHIQIHKRIPRD